MAQIKSPLVNLFTIEAYGKVIVNGVYHIQERHSSDAAPLQMLIDGGNQVPNNLKHSHLCKIPGGFGISFQDMYRHAYLKEFIMIDS